MKPSSVSEKKGGAESSAEEGDCAFQVLTDAVLEWYAAHRRSFPWRAQDGEPPNPYFVWLSEIMLQQTTVGTVRPYFERFIMQWPTVQALARASLDEVRTVWSGLGYYSRAEHLHQTAQKLANAMVWPESPTLWQTYPGVGPYTAAAISAIAFNFPTIPVDGNVVRVVRRLFSIPCVSRQELIRAVRAQTRVWQEKSQAQWGNLAQGLMDLGATVCTPRQPQCGMCPLKRFCSFDPQTEVDTTLPKTRPLRLSYALCLMNDRGELYVEQERSKKLLKGLTKVPLVDLVEAPSAPLPFVRAVFTHFIWNVWIVRVAGLRGRPRSLVWKDVPENCKALPFAHMLQEALTSPLMGEWLTAHELEGRPQSALFRKIVDTLGLLNGRSSSL